LAAGLSFVDVFRGLGRFQGGVFFRVVITVKNRK
jgi:hypothetical protein